LGLVVEWIQHVLDADQLTRLAGHAGRKRDREVARRCLPVGRDGHRSSAVAAIDKPGVAGQALDGQGRRAQRIKG